MDVSQQRETPAVVSTSYDERVMGICKSEQLEEVRGARQEKEVGAAKLATAPAAQLYAFSFFSLTYTHAQTHTRFLLFFVIVVNPRHFFHCSLHKYNQSHELKTVFSKPIKRKIH